MALHKRVKQGGTYYKGYQLVVLATTGDYVLHVDTDHAVVVNGIQLIPDAYGVGDYITIKHYTNTAGNVVVDSIADSIFNAGKNASVELDFPALEPMLPNEDMRIIYTNIAGTAAVLSVIVEFAR